VKSAFIRGVLCAVVFIAVLAGAVRPLTAQVQPDDPATRYVRMYNNLSAITMTGSVASGAWNVVSPSDLSIFTGFAFTAVEYGMVLTGARSDPVSQGMVLGHVAVGAVTGTLSYLGLKRWLRDRDAAKRARERQQRVQLVPHASADRSGGVVTFRF
jgi:hypothetical protein